MELKMTTYELMELVLIDEDGNYHFGKNVTALDKDGKPTNVDSNSCTVGSAEEIIAWLKKHDKSINKENHQHK